jgi:hypothetical protein
LQASQDQIVKNASIRASSTEKKRSNFTANFYQSILHPEVEPMRAQILSFFYFLQVSNHEASLSFPSKVSRIEKSRTFYLLKTNSNQAYY